MLLLNDFPIVIDTSEPVESANLPALATSQEIIEVKKMLQAQQELSNRLLDRISKQEEKSEVKSFWSRLFRG